MSKFGIISYLCTTHKPKEFLKTNYGTQTWALSSFTQY